MTDGYDSEALPTEEELDEIPHVEFDIAVSPSDLTLELIANKVQQNDIIIPFYQRKFVWKIEQASRLIESFLMGLPVPQVFLYINEEDQLEVIDGQQRIMSVKYFLEGLFGEEDNKGKRQVFKLKGLSERSAYNGKTFLELSPRDQRKIKNSTLRAINIKQVTPSNASDSVFHIFQRLNTGGTQLKPQEIRNAVYRGNIVVKLEELNQDPDWQAILGLRAPDKTQKDVELVLRLFSLFENWTNYEKPMLHFLNKEMKENRKFDSKRADRFVSRFPKVTELINSTLDRPFRPKSVINSGVLEAVMIALLERDKPMSAAQLQAGYDSLLEDDEFLDSIVGGTTDTLVLQYRQKLAKAAFANAAG